MTRLDAARFLSEQDRFCILTHRRPDGDTLGSAAFLCRMLRKLGKQAHILPNPELTQKYACLHEGLTKPAAEEGDTLITVDTATAALLPAAFAPLAPQAALRIDHHSTPTGYARQELVDPGAAACGEILWDISQILGICLDEAMADALYVAISTDTGCFRYANTTAHTFEAAAACAKAGGHVFRWNQRLFETNSLAKLRLQGWMTQNTQFLDGGNMAVCALPRSVEQEIGIREDEMESISGFLRTIEGVRMSALVRQTGDGRVKLSVRALPGLDAAAICAQFGGGGHKGAAGATVDLTLEEAARQVALAMLQQ